MDRRPEELVATVESCESFLEFVKALQVDREQATAIETATPSSPYATGANGWENGTVEAFLEAMHAWALDSGALGRSPSWRALAQLLLAGKAYE